MKLEDQVCSLELAKKLKELGVKQESHFYWNREHFYKEHQLVSGTFTWKTDDKDGRIAAFTVAELGEMLPYGTKSSKEGRWYCHLQYIQDPHINKDFARTEVSETEANGRAKMLVYLIEQGIVKPNDQ